MIRVKICGINDAASFDAAVDAGAHWVAFNFFPPSPRCVTPEAAAALSARAVGGPQRVGLFVEPTDAAIATVLDAVRLDILQLYATPARIAELRARFRVPIWRAVGVASTAELPATADGADALLIEPKPPEGAKQPGGNAVSLDWRITRNWSPPFPWLLAGGLTPDNVAAAIAASGAQAVDVASGVESSRGRKDPELIRRFIAAARAG